ncbi:MAG TPA: ribonuclease H [Egibacteraceae bacterium]|nr:ribonuclease H [Egibacteraceae bacterium]
MATLTCTSCGAAFTLPEHVRERYPGWAPKQCRACHTGEGREAPRGGAGRGGVEENLTVAEVLAKYSKGPADGVFTDGSAHPNPGPGGWGAVYVVDGEVVDQAHGREDHTTNNRMELTALIAGYDLVPPRVSTTVYTDSKLCVDTITKWAPAWERRGWSRKTGPIANLDLVQQLYERARARPEIELAWIAAHSGARWNEYADSLSTAYRRTEL